MNLMRLRRMQKQDETKGQKKTPAPLVENWSYQFNQRCLYTDKSD